MNRVKIITLLAVALSGLGISAWGAGIAPSPTELVQQALDAMSDGNPRQAERVATELANSRSPDASRAWLIVAAAREKMGAYTQAQEAYRSFLAGCTDPTERAFALEHIGKCAAASAPVRQQPPASSALTDRQRTAFAVVRGEQVAESSDHFVVYAYNASLAKYMAGQAERALTRICRGILSEQQYPHSVNIYIWPDTGQYKKNAGVVNEWAGGSFSLKADADGNAVRRIDLTQLDAGGNFDPITVDRVLPHEMCHLVLTEYFGDAQCPLVINEGLAMMAEVAPDNNRLILAGNAIGSEKKITLDQLLTLDKPDKVDASVFYAEAYSLTSYLHQRLTRQQFAATLAHVKNGCSIEDAIQRALYVPPDENFLGNLTHAWENEAIRQSQFLQALDTARKG